MRVVLPAIYCLILSILISISSMIFMLLSFGFFLNLYDYHAWGFIKQSTFDVSNWIICWIRICQIGFSWARCHLLMFSLHRIVCRGLRYVTPTSWAVVISLSAKRTLTNYFYVSVILLLDVVVIYIPAS